MLETQAYRRLEREDFATVTVLRVQVSLLWDDETTAGLFEEMVSVIDDQANLILNLGQLDFLASAAIMKLVMLMRKVRAAGGRLVLCKVRPTIEDLLRVTQLADVLPHYADEQEALCSF
jgi:anti-sigma B factor antagonist